MVGKLALFDMDGTIADYYGKLMTDLRNLGTEQIPDKLHGERLPDWLHNRISLIKSHPGWWESLPFIPSGKGLMELCKDIGFEIYILTQGPSNNPGAWTEKFNWCERNVKPIAPEYGISITRNGKGLHYGRVFVDDWPPYMEKWLEHRPRGLGLMPASPENVGFSHPQVIRYNPLNWRTPELEERLREAYDRGNGQN